MHRRRRLALLIGGALAAVGIVVFVVYFFQPWRSCAYEDTSAGCAMLPRDALIMMSAFVVALLGLIVVLVSLMQRRSKAPD